MVLLDWANQCISTPKVDLWCPHTQQERHQGSPGNSICLLFGVDWTHIKADVAENITFLTVKVMRKVRDRWRRGAGGLSVSSDCAGVHGPCGQTPHVVGSWLTQRLILFIFWTCAACWCSCSGRTVCAHASTPHHHAFLLFVSKLPSRCNTYQSRRFLIKVCVCVRLSSDVLCHYLLPLALDTQGQTETGVCVCKRKNLICNWGKEEKHNEKLHWTCYYFSVILHV